MIEIKDLLAKFDKILLSEEMKTKTIREIIGKIIKLEIKPADIKIKNNTIYLNIKPIYKNEIFLKKEEITREINQIFGLKSPKI